jgi:PAS domain S-box-containing protein
MKMTKALRLTLVFAFIGFVASFLVFFVHSNIFSTTAYHNSYAKLPDNARINSVIAYQKLHGFLAGNQIDFQREILDPLVAVQVMLQSAYDGKKSGAIQFKKSEDEQLRALIKQSGISSEKLGNSCNELWQLNKRGGTDSLAMVAMANLTAKTDNVYNELQQTLRTLDGYVGRQYSSSQLLMKRFSWSVGALVVLAFSFLVVSLYRLQRNSQKTIDENNLKVKAESDRVETLSGFVEAVSAGNFNIALNNTADDNLTAMLVNMRDKLKNNAEEDRRRNWSTSGLAQIGEILRATNNSAQLYDNIIRFIVKYTKSNQGGLFILSEEEGRSKHMELVACYAFERKKYLTKQVEPGDGLVGQCFLEGLRIYLTDLPEEYVNITSGLGGSAPRALLIVPLKVNDSIYGVIELASFNFFEEFEIQLVEKLAESIASTISSVRVNETTRQLLERTQQQAEEMKSQEEEIRQNMEELEATQEEMRRKQDILEQELTQSQQQASALKMQEKKLLESQETLQAIVDHLPRAIFWKDRELRFMGCNRIFAGVAGVSSPKELIGKTDFDMAWSAQAEAYRNDDLEVMRTQKPKLDIEEVNINSEGEESWVLTSKVPIVNEDREVVAILGMFEDITARKRKEADVNRKLQEREDVLKELNALKQVLEARKV